MEVFSFNNVKITRKYDLCLSCEICSVICPENAITYEYKSGQFLPKINEQCTSCKKCLMICPGIEVDPFNLKSNKHSENSLNGDSLEAYTIHSKNFEIRKNASSGGFVTSLILELLKNKEYDSAFVLNFNKFNLKTARLEEVKEHFQLLNSSKSKYIPASAYNIIKTLKKNENKRYIIVGTPCIIQGIQKYMKINGLSQEKILFIGLFCDRTFNFNILKYYEEIYKLGSESVLKFEFRTKEKEGWPGNTKLTFDSGREIFVNKHIRMQLKKYFTLNRCLFCLNGKLNPTADISVGDCYLQEELDSKGKSNIIIRNEKGKYFFDKYSYLFSFEKVNINRIKESQKTENRTRNNLNLFKMFSNENDLYSDFTLGSSSEELNNMLKEQEHIKWGKNFNINRIRISLIYDIYINKLTIYFKISLISLILSLNVLKDIFSFTFKKSSKYNDDKNNIMIIGGGLFNKGAQAMTFTTVNELKKIFPEKNIYLLSELDFQKKLEYQNLYNFNILPWNPEIKTILLGLPKKFKLNLLNVRNKDEDVDKLIEVIENTDFIVDISGYRLTSNYGIFASFDYILNIMTAKKFNVSYYILPQSIGPFNYPLKFKFILLLIGIYLRYPLKIFVRENEGIKSLKGFNLKNIQKSFDVVLNHSKYELNNIYKQNVNIKKISLKPNSIGIIPNSRVFERTDSKYLYSIYESLIKIILNHGKSVYILRHSYEDLEICENIKNLLPNNENVKLIEYDLNALELEFIINQFDLVIASRYHSVIHSYKNLVPVLVIGWANKYLELLESFEQEQYYFDIREGINKILIEKQLEYLFENYHEDKLKIKAQMCRIKNEKNIYELIRRR